MTAPSGTTEAVAPPTSGTALTDHPASNRVVVLLALAISFLFAVYLGAMGLVLPRIGALFQVTPAVQGQVFLASFGGSVSGVLLSGTLSDRLGRKPVLLLCLAATLCGTLLFARSPSFLGVLLASGLVGAGGAGAQTVSSALLSDLFAERRTVYINAIQIAFGAGAVCAPLFVQPFVLTGGNWRIFYLLLAGFQAALLILLALLRVSRSASTPVSETASSGSVNLLRERPLLVLCLSAFLYSGAEVALFSWMPTYLQTFPGGATAAGLVVSAFWLPMTVGRACLSLLLRRVSLHTLRFGLAAGGTLASTLALLLPQPWWMLAGVALSGLFFSGIFSVLLADGGSRYPHTAGTTLGLIVATSGAGAAILPWLVGTLRDTDLPWAGALAVVPVAMLLIVLLSLGRRSSR
ncbi:MAG: MFS transporter [Armatimonadaceae bacterium]